jgi:hypothetical protein
VVTIRDLLSNVSAGNIKICRRQHVARELRFDQDDLGFCVFNPSCRRRTSFMRISQCRIIKRQCFVYFRVSKSDAHWALSGVKVLRST